MLELGTGNWQIQQNKVVGTIGNLILQYPPISLVLPIYIKRNSIEWKLFTKKLMFIMFTIFFIDNFQHKEIIFETFSIQRDYI